MTRLPHDGLDYRGDIDGLRAVAVVAVVAFHAFPGLVPGGYAGVDVFFVISGYLISLILFGELQKAGRIDLWAFYRRRLRRIVPALALVLVATLSLAWFVLLPDELARLAHHAAGAAVFIANFQYWGGAGYFAPGAEHLPLLHLWSLAIEEQFYLLWPLALMLAARRRDLTALLLPALFLVSLVVCLNSDNAVAAFYSPLSRAWELLAGALLAFWVSRLQAEGRRFRLPPRLREAAAFAGLVLIVGTVIFASPDTAWPGWPTLLPVAGTVLLIGPAAGSRVSRTLLANPLAIGIGLVSYPLYLWHWPLLAFGHILHAGYPPVAVRAGLVAAGLLLAIATYRLVERPIRFGRWRRAAPIALAAMLAFIAIGAFSIDRADGVPGRAISRLNALAFTAGLGDGGNLTEAGCLAGEPPVRRPFSFCRRDATLDNRALVWGDSKGEALYWGLVRESHRRGGAFGWQLAGQLGGCPPMGKPGATRAPECDFGNAAIVEALVADPAIHTVVLVTGLRTIRYNGLQQSFDGVDAAVAKLLAAGRRVIFVIDNPTVVGEREDPKDCVRVTLLPALERLIGRRDCDMPIPEHHADTAAYRAAVADLAARNPRLEIFDTEPLLCDTALGICPVARGGAVLYSYGDHISDAANGLLAERLLALASARRAEPPLPLPAD